ncbi:MAG TPA: hypothetical protein VFM34_05135 [Moraxellaceae bacterium]|nr:hypothetical protein [Moraxellaceae bacterium]
MPVPSSITDLSTTAASNSPAGSDPISTNLDDYLRAIQAILRAESLNKSWEAPGHTATWLSATQFTIPTDVTSTYRVGRRIKATLAGPTYAYSTITASAFAAGVTTVTVANDSTVLSSPISAIEVGPDSIAMIESGSAVASRAWVQALAATTAAAGILEILDSTEFATGTDSTRAMVASLFSPSKSATAMNITLPGGIILKVGKASAGSSSVNQTITFPTAFPTACIAVFFTTDVSDSIADNAAVAAGYYRILSKSASNFVIAYTARERLWFAVGY